MGKIWWISELRNEKFIGPARKKVNYHLTTIYLHFVKLKKIKKVNREIK